MPTSELNIVFDGRPNFRPNDPITGTVSWKGIEADDLECRLIWYTQGKGDQDFETIQTQPIQSTSPNGSARFQFVAPNRPHSFSGKLISLTWAVEVVLFPSREGHRKTIYISNQGTEIILDKSYDDELMKPFIKVV